MGEYPLLQSSLRRAVIDTRQAHQNPWLFWIVEAVMTALGGILGNAYTPEGIGKLLSAMYPTVGGVLGAIVGIVIIFIINLFLAPYRQRNDALRLVGSVQKQYDAILASARFAIAFDGLSVDLITNKSDGITVGRIGVKFQNIRQILIQYTMTKMKVVLDGKTVDDPKFRKRTVNIHPGQPSEYFYPDISGVDLTKSVVSGTLEYEIEYSSVPSKYWFRSRRELLFDIFVSQQRHEYRIQEEEESEISQPSISHS